MASYRVGQRVRMLRECISGGPPVKGKEATIIDIGEFEGESGKIHPVEVLVDGLGSSHVCCYDEIEPLTDPGQQEFRAEDILTLENLSEGPKRDATMPADMAKAWASDRY